MRRFALLSLLPCLLAVFLASGGEHARLAPHSSTLREKVFARPADALSLQVSGGTMDLELRSYDGAWSGWQRLTLENEQDPRLRESNLMIFPKAVSRVQVRGSSRVTAFHPIAVSAEPPHYEVASTAPTAAPRILSRREWGADESFLLASGSETADPADEPADNEQSSPSARESDCERNQKLYPAEFHTVNRTTKDAQGRPLLWTREYSTAVKLLTVHHTALSTANDGRTAVERMRALYQYHSVNRGWGDIGYHYVIDEDGQIYEGKSGGEFVVGGHAYCNNVGTLGIALMGNFDAEKPALRQIRSLQWLLQSLADKYKIDLDSQVSFHGETLPPVVGHRQLVSTDCPGEYVWRTLDQILMHARTGDVNAPVVFPALQKPGTSKPTTPARGGTAAGFSALGSMDIQARPGGEIVIPVLFRAGDKSYKQGAAIGIIARSHPRIALMQERDGTYVRVSKTLYAPTRLAKNASTMVRVRVQLPPDSGNYTVAVGDVTFRIQTSGRRVRTRSTIGDYTTYPTISSASSSSVSSVSSTTRRPSQPSAVGIRIRLHDTQPDAQQIVLSSTTATEVNGLPMGTAITLTRSADRCSASGGGKQVTSSAVRVDPGDGVTIVTSWARGYKRFRGVLECRVIDGALVLINELPLDTYLAGLGEEPDTEPYEKQRAFAIAARTYAAFYMDPAHRKFPGKPYDGSDLPSEFQVYSGVGFELDNPAWLRAVRSTAGQILTVNGDAIKPPYFSSDDGRTRSPAEAGWNNFPHAEVFASKPDPWCEGMELRGHGVGMSGCGSEAQANEGKTGEQILQYYYPGARIERR